MKKSMAAVAAAALLALSPLSAPAQAEIVQPDVSIRAVLDLPDFAPTRGAKVFRVDDTTVGSGVELRPSDVVAGTESRWGGDIQVDLDPETRTINVSSVDTDSFQYIAARITSPHLRLWQKTADAFVLGNDNVTVQPVKVVQISADTFELRWTSKPDEFLKTTTNVTTFTYRHVSKLSVAAQALKRKVKLSPKLSVFGFAAPSGPVKVYEGSKFRGTINVVNGVGSKFISAKKGKRTFTLKYAGSSSAAPVTKTVTVKIK